MSSAENFSHFFKPEARTSGQKLFQQEKVSLPSGSDTDIQGYVKASPPVRVRLASDDIASETFTVECNCPQAKKGSFCKHIWATLLATEKKYPDFLSAKKDITKPESTPEKKTENQTQTQTQTQTAAQTAFESSRAAYKESAKEKASLYRKIQYQKQKLNAKKRKNEREGRETIAPTSNHPPEIDEALSYFEKNGFPMPNGPDEATIGEAKRKLSRVFHPDKGGSDEEMYELNNYCELLLSYFPG